MNKYFKNCKTAEEAKQEYKKLARELHPDCNHKKDTTEEFQKMQADFENAWKRLKDTHVNAEGEMYTKETNETAKSVLKELNFRWSRKKSAWYFHFEPYKKRSKKERTMEDIRNMYGSERFQTRTREPEMITV